MIMPWVGRNDQSVPDVVTAGSFRLLVTYMGHWQPARSEVSRVLHAVIPRFVQLVGFKERDNYLVVLLPTLEFAGESYRHSFAFTLDAAPSRANRALWSRTIAHEIFHYWNGWRLHGSEYVTSRHRDTTVTIYAGRKEQKMLFGKLRRGDLRKPFESWSSSFEQLIHPKSEWERLKTRLLSLLLRSCFKSMQTDVA